MTVPFFFNDTATTEIYTLSLHDALPIYEGALMRPAQTLGRLERGAAEVVPRGGQRASEGVEHEVRRLRHDRRGNVLRSEEHTSELQSRLHLVCRLLLEKKNNEHRRD